MTAVFFDLDGTLTDPKEGITKCVQHALQRLNEAVPSNDDLEWVIGPPLRASFVELVGEARADQAVALYRERFSDIGWRENQLYQEIPTVLQQLKSRGVQLYVATSKPRVFAERIVDHFDLAGYFEQVFGSELDGTRQDKTELLTWARQKTKQRDSIMDACMIGDRKHDIIGGRNNDMHTVGITWGYGSVTELESAGAHDIVHQPDDLLAVLPS